MSRFHDASKFPPRLHDDRRLAKLFNVHLPKLQGLDTSQLDIATGMKNTLEAVRVLETCQSKFGQLEVTISNWPEEIPPYPSIDAMTRRPLVDQVA